MIYKLNITLSVSDKHFDNKPISKDISKLTYSVIRDLPITELRYLIKKGYCFTHVFTNSSTFGINDKRIENFIQTNIIPVDIDNSDVDINEFIETLDKKPTIAYTTFSNQQEGKGYRFRLLYILNSPIKSIERYEDAYTYFTSGLQIEDNCMKSVAQQWFGTSEDAVYIFNGKIYDITAIPHIEKREYKKCHSNCIIKGRGDIIQLERHFDDNFLNDFYNMSYGDFLREYRNIYTFFQSSELETVDDDTPYILLPENYLEIKRYWLVDTQINDEGEVERRNSRVRRLKDGENRRKMLFINGILRRFMKNDITIEYLLTMITYELYYFIDNRKDPITKNELMKIAIRCYNTDLNNYSDLAIQKHPSFIVNDNYCIKYVVNRKQARNIAKKEIKYKEIGNLYDCSLSDKENLKTLNDNGIKVSLSTLKRFKKDMGLSKVNKKCHSNYIIKEREGHYTIRMTLLEKEEEEKNNTIMTRDKLDVNLKKLYDKYALIENENEAIEKYNLMVCYLNKHKAILDNKTYNRNLEYMNAMKLEKLALYSNDFDYFVSYFNMAC